MTLALGPEQSEPVPLQCILTTTILFASWARTDLGVQQLALLVFSLLSTAAVMGLHLNTLLGPRRRLVESHGGDPGPASTAAVHARSIDETVPRSGTLSLFADAEVLGL